MYIDEVEKKLGELDEMEESLQEVVFTEPLETIEERIEKELKVPSSVLEKISKNYYLVKERKSLYFTKILENYKIAVRSRPDLKRLKNEAEKELYNYYEKVESTIEKRETPSDTARALDVLNLFYYGVFYGN